MGHISAGTVSSVLPFIQMTYLKVLFIKRPTVRFIRHAPLFISRGQQYQGGRIVELKNRMPKNRSGISTILVVVVVVVVLIVAAAAVYVVLSNNDKGGEETKEWAPGTVMKYKVEYGGSEIASIDMEIVGQNADEFFVKQTVTFGTTGIYEYGVEPKGDPEGEKTGTIDLETIDGWKTLDVWSSSGSMKSYVDPSNSIMYGGEMVMPLGETPVTVTLSLTNYDIKWQKSYSESDNIGKTYVYSGEMGGSTYSCEITCVADCVKGQYGVKYDFGGEPTYFVSDNPSGLPADAEDTGDSAIIPTIDGDKTTKKWEYTDFGEDVTTFYCDPASKMIYRFILVYEPDNIVFNLTEKP